ncbi:MAG: MFS transporter [Actinomycetota bacterium]|nr:MFS transporter [Actinomycetota bacterium]
MAGLYTGSSLAPVLGVPAATRAGQQAGWRVAFAALGFVAALTCLAVVVALPSVPPHEEAARVGEEPDARRYALLVVATALAVAGTFAAYTYLTAHLLHVARLPESSLGPVLLLFGVAGVLGAIASGLLLGSRPRVALLLPLATLTVALILLFGYGSSAAVAVATFTLLSVASTVLAAAIQARSLQVAPASTDMASAGTSSAYNAGIASGAWLGGLLVAGPGVPATALAGAALVATALAVLLTEPLVVPQTRTPAAAEAPQPASCG